MCVCVFFCMCVCLCDILQQFLRVPDGEIMLGFPCLTRALSDTCSFKEIQKKWGHNRVEVIGKKRMLNQGEGACVNEYELENECR